MRADARSRRVFQRGNDDAAARLSSSGPTSALHPADAPARTATGRSARKKIIVSSRQRHGKPVAEIDAALEAALGKGSTAKTEEQVGVVQP